MPKMSRFSCILMLLIFIDTTLAIHSPEHSPSPAPELAQEPSYRTPPPEFRAAVNSPTWSPVSPPAFSPVSAPRPASPTHASSWSPMKSPVPVPGGGSEGSTSRGEMGGGMKAGIVVGVVGAVVVVGVAGIVYKKRRKNIQRAQYGNGYGYAPRREVL